MNKSEFISAIAEKSGLTKKDSEKALKAITDIITDTLKDGGSVRLVGFGTFEGFQRAERIGRNPKDQTPLTIKAAKVPKFRPGKSLKNKINV